MDFDPRDYDSRDDDRFAPLQDRGGHGGSDRDDERDDELSRPAALPRDRDEEGRDLGRGPGDSRESYSDERGRDARDDARWPERDRDERTRDIDPREVFTRHLNLPCGVERELVRDRDREYTLRGSESRTLATVGAFRVVSSRDLRDHNDRPTDPRSGDLRHLREQGLVETVRVPGYREQAVTLTKEGRSLLEHHRDRDQGDRQTFYNGVKRERELEHDVQVYRAYERHAERLEARGASIERVVLDYELKRDYQKWLHERDRDRDDYDGHPDRTAEEIREWALEHHLAYFDDEVHFPDLRIEYELDGRLEHRDVEVTTDNYRGAHAASVAKAGYSCYRGSSARIGGGSSRGGGSPFDPGIAEDLI
jgi:DNA-binding MarR family transcriptional regulator